VQIPQFVSLLVGLIVVLIGFTATLGAKTKRIKLAERLPNIENAELSAILNDSFVSSTTYGRFYINYVKPQLDNHPDLFKKLTRLLGIDLDKLDQKIKEAKMEKQVTKEEIASMKILGILGALMCVFLGVVFGPVFLIISFLCYLVVGFIPQMILDQRVRQRKETIEKELPDFLELLKSVMEAGLVIQEAITKVTERLSSPLAEEFRTVMAETKANGGQWRLAMENMAFRNNIDALSDVVADILISYDKGTPITDTLEKEASMMRQLRNFRCQEKAKGLSIKLVIPMAIFSFFPILVLMLAPMLIQMARVM